MEEFPSGQREQTVNLSAMPSVVRIHPLPPYCGDKIDVSHEKARFYRAFLLPKRLRAQYDTKIDGNGWLEVSSDGIPLCRIKYNGQYLEQRRPKPLG